jgi:hypothetical protein
MRDPDYGETVAVSPLAPEAMRPGKLGAVVGITDVETPPQAVHYGAPVGTRIYLVEFGDGEATEIPQGWITPSQGL